MSSVGRSSLHEPARYERLGSLTPVAWRERPQAAQAQQTGEPNSRKRAPFQTPAYLKDQAAARKIPLVSIIGVHVLYSKSVKDLAGIPSGAEVAIPNDATNETRALRLLAANDLLTLKDETAETITPCDATENPKKLKFTEVEAAQTPRSLDDADLAVINGNYALEADLTPSRDALALEKAEGNPNANLVATVESKKDDPRIKKLAELLTSPEVKAFIEGRYNGSVIPAF